MRELMTEIALVICSSTLGAGLGFLFAEAFMVVEPSIAPGLFTGDQGTLIHETSMATGMLMGAIYALVKIEG